MKETRGEIGEDKEAILRQDSNFLNFLLSLPSFESLSSSCKSRSLTFLWDIGCALDFIQYAFFFTQLTCLIGLPISFLVIPSQNMVEGHKIKGG